MAFFFTPTPNPTFLQNSLTLCSAAYTLSESPLPNRAAYRKLMDLTKRVVDFQLKFLHEEAKNVREDYADIKSRLLAQKRSTESEFREFKRRCSPETDHVGQFCSEFVTGMTKLASVFCKAHVLACIATVEMAERDLAKTRKALAGFLQGLSARRTAEATAQKAYERLSRYLAILGEEASYMSLREIISSEELKSTLSGYFDYFNQLNEELASCLNEAVRVDASEEHLHKYLDLCAKIAIDVEALITDFAGTLEEEVVFLIKLDLTKSFLKSIQDLDKSRLRPKDLLERTIQARKARTQLRLRNKAANPLLVQLEEHSDVIDLIVEATQKMLVDNQTVEKPREIVQKVKDVLADLPSLSEKVVAEQRQATENFLHMTKAAIENAVAASSGKASQGTSAEVRLLTGLLNTLGDNRRFRMLADAALEARIKEVADRLQGRVDSATLPDILADVSSFAAALVEAGGRSLATMDAFRAETTKSFAEVSRTLAKIDASLQQSGAQQQRAAGDLLKATCEKVYEIIRLCAATAPEHDDDDGLDEAEDEALMSYASSENLLSSAPQEQSGSGAGSRGSSEADAEDAGSSIKSSEDLDGEDNGVGEGGGGDGRPRGDGTERKVSSSTVGTEDHLHPAHWFYASPDAPGGGGSAPGAAGAGANAPRPATGDDQNIWKETWGGLVFVEENGKMQIEAASLNQLLIRLTSTSPDSLAASDFYRTFMMTMQTFTEPELFVRKLVERYEVPPCPQQSELEQKRYEMHLRTPVQMRVCNLLKKWLVERYDQDLANRPLLIEELFNFIDNRVAQDSEYLSNNLRRVLTLYITGEGFRYHQKLAQENAQLEASEGEQFPRVAVESQLSLSHFDPREVAEQLTLYDAELFRAIRLYELAGQAWNKRNAIKLAPNLMKLINQTNKLSTWVANAICKEPILKKRRKIMVNMVLLCQQLLLLRNFNSVMGVLGGLAAAAVARLKFTESGLPPKVKKVFEDVQQEMSSSNSFKSYRDKLRSSTAPTIPFMGVVLSDLTFIEDGNQDYTADGLIYWAKRTLLYGVLSEFLEYQRGCLYEHPPFPSLRDAVKHSLNSLSTPLKDLYELSLLIEPRAGLPQEKPKGLLDRLKGL